MQLALTNVSHYYGKRPALANLSLTLEEGEIGALIGPSGAGKSTVLNCIAGLAHVSAGEISIGGQLMSSKDVHVPAERRRVGLMFQDAALFPHMDVHDNVAFGVKGSNKEKEDRVVELMAKCHIEGLERARPHELSGGQRQRVALARALAPRPRLLLLDEPFSDSDATLRDNLVAQVRSVMRTENATALLVTHDQREAFALADKCGVIDAGTICQWDTVYNVYHRPSCVFAAEFIGDGVMVDATLASDHEVSMELGTVTSKTPLTTPMLRPGGAVKILIRPDDVVLAKEGGVRARVAERLFRGSHIHCQLETSKGTRIDISLPSRHDVKVGDFILVRPQVEHVVIFPTIS